MNNETIEKAKTKMTDSIKVYQKRLASIRAGVANAALLDNVQVEYYGAPTPLTQMSSITIPEPRVLLITPYDHNSLDDIEHALLASNLGLTPANDGKVIRLKRDVARLRGQIQPLGRKNAFCFQLFGTAPVEERPCHAAVDHARLVTLLGKDWFVVRRQELHRAVLFFYHDAQLFRLHQNRCLRFFRTPRKRGICLRLPVRILHFCGHALYETDADHLRRDRGDA